jgi:hypothetical protein
VAQQDVKDEWISNIYYILAINLSDRKELTLPNEFHI